nr:hypothetical protein CFP56_73062 [Quercus suber]
MAVLFWMIWEKRNSDHVGGCWSCFKDIQPRALGLLRDFAATQAPIRHHHPFISTQRVRWIPPISPQYKVNYDGAIFKEIWAAGLGVVIRDSDGGMVGALAERIPFPPSVATVEALDGGSNHPEFGLVINDSLRLASGFHFFAAARTNFNTPKPDKDHFIPNTPIPQESKVSTNFTNSGSIKADCVPADIVRNDDDYSYLNYKTCQAADEPHNIASDNDTIGNFPSPTELANLDEGFLASRCNLGYRGNRIWKLARDIVEGRIQLTKIEEANKGASFSKSSNYYKLAKQLKEIDAFGTFTSANVLMCMGYYHVIPTDFETIWHLRKVHVRYSTVQMVQRDIECVYEKYAPFQFLAY